MSARLGVLLAPLVLLAGCTGAPGEAPAAQADDALRLVNDVEALVHRAGAVGGRLAADVAAATFPLDHDAAEPTIAITSDGTLFYAAATFDNLCGPPNPVLGCLPRTDILRSRDRGLTWEDVTPFLPGGVARAHPETGDPMVYVDPTTDRVFDIDQRAVVGSYTVSVSDDLGGSWQGPFVACNEPPCDHQTIVAAKPRTLTTTLYENVVLVCYNQVHSTTCQRSLDGGMTWQRTAPPFLGVAPEGVCGGSVGHLRAAQDGTLYLPKDQCGRPALAITQDDGLTWRVVEVANVVLVGMDPVVQVDRAGNLYYAFLAEEDSHLHLATSVDQGATWSEPVDVTPPGLTAAHLPALAAGDAGRLAIAFVGTDDPEGFERSPEVELRDANATWHGYLSIVTDALSPTPTIVTVRVNPLDDPLVRGRCGPGRCPGLTDFIDVAMDPEGRPWAAFVDACSAPCAAAERVENDMSAGFVATIARGPGLLESAPSLAPR